MSSGSRQPAAGRGCHQARPGARETAARTRAVFCQQLHALCARGSGATTGTRCWARHATDSRRGMVKPASATSTWSPGRMSSCCQRLQRTHADPLHAVIVQLHRMQLQHRRDTSRAAHGEGHRANFGQRLCRGIFPRHRPGRRPRLPACRRRPMPLTHAPCRRRQTACHGDTTVRASAARQPVWPPPACRSHCLPDPSRASQPAAAPCPPAHSASPRRRGRYVAPSPHPGASAPTRRPPQSGR